MAIEIAKQPLFSFSQMEKRYQEWIMSAWKECDRNGDKKVDLTEIGNLLSKWNYNLGRSEIKDIIRHILAAGNQQQQQQKHHHTPSPSALSKSTSTSIESSSTQSNTLKSSTTVSNTTTTTTTITTTTISNPTSWWNGLSIGKLDFEHFKLLIKMISKRPEMEVIFKQELTEPELLASGEEIVWKESHFINFMKETQKVCYYAFFWILLFFRYSFGN